MKVPLGLKTAATVNKVCRIKKSLYGLKPGLSKQSPKARFERFTCVLKKHGYFQSQSDRTMFIKYSQKGQRAILIVYVDYIILTRDLLDEIPRIKGWLAEEFEIKDL
ncbi:hypothetical protein LWI29_031288 [Acer saccharum]|uniref:Reverse transcriptase Ty1/copia-type domain-containing protein n=1 Tax=Acer saccharum TaxID=4024 RepID=A0AA39SZW5_ACESA|nr:hypothetical protein LWI29_031288 [Acer saccharum]